MDSSTDNDVSCIHFPFFISKLFSLSSGRGGYLLTRINPQVLVSPARKGMSLILAICWIIGIVFGVFCYSSSPTEVTSLMHRTLSCSVSIVGLLNAALIPFLLSALFMALSMPVMLFVLCFLKAFLFSFVSMGVLAYAGSGGWLLRYLFLFSDCVTLPVLFGYWFGFVSAPIKSRLVLTTCVVLLALAVVTILDYHVIAPIVCVIDSMKG